MTKSSILHKKEKKYNLTKHKRDAYLYASLSRSRMGLNLNI